MKTKIKLVSVIFLIGIAMTTIVNAQTGVTSSGTQTAGNITKWILGSPSYTIGNSSLFETGTGVGIGTTSPVSKLDVNGSVNVSSGSAYKLDGNALLFQNNFGGSPSGLIIGQGAGQYVSGTSNNTFVGTNSGSVTGSGGGGSESDNTFVGYETGFNNAGNENTFIGSWAGLANLGGSDNSFLGQCSGKLNTTGNENTFIGHWSGTFNTACSDNTALGAYALVTQAYTGTITTNNVAIGDHALAHNNPAATSNSGSNNTALGSSAGYTNTTGYNDVFMGYQAAYLNTTGYHNIATGVIALGSNTTGFANIAVGSVSLYGNTTGNYNTATGMYSLHANTTANANTAGGYSALYTNTTGYDNTAFGYYAGYTYPKDTACTFMGLGADASGNYYNAGAFGYSAIAPASNKIYMGNTTLIGVYNATGSFTTSDGRFKTNVTENVKGLAFINKLRPVTYKLDTKALDDFLIQNMPDSVKTVHQAGMDFAPSKAIIHSGFIAQEVEAAAASVGFISSIVSAPTNSTDPYALSYAEIVVPLVKAVQELSKTSDSLKTKTTNQDSVNTYLQHKNNSEDSIINVLKNKDSIQDYRLTVLENALNTCCNNRSMLQNNNSTPSTNSIGSLSSMDVNLKDGQSVVLDQNVPNPFAEQTTINYFLPDNVVKAQMLFYNGQGKLIQSVDLNEKGKGSLNVFANDLSNGVYTYTLVADGKIIDTKKMMKQQ